MGHPNSLGRTVEVVEAFVSSPARFDDLFGGYRSDDPVVRRNASSMREARASLAKLRRESAAARARAMGGASLVYET